MDKDLKRAIEHELKYLSEYRERLEQMKLDLLDKGSGPAVMSRSTFPSDPTCIKALRFMDINTKISSLEMRIKRIEIAVKSLPKPEYELIRMRYFVGMGYNNGDVMNLLGISMRNYYYIRNRAFMHIADFIGEKKLLEWQKKKI